MNILGFYPEEVRKYDKLDITAEAEKILIMS